MTATQAKLTVAGRSWPRTLVRLGSILLLAVGVSWGVHRSMETVGRSGRPAGFRQGMLHGALMPCALPNLLLGHDVSIYADEQADEMQAEIGS